MFFCKDISTAASLRSYVIFIRCESYVTLERCFDPGNKEVCKYRSSINAVATQTFAPITSIGQSLPIRGKLVLFLLPPSLSLSVSRRVSLKFPRYAHLSNRARLRKVSSSIAIWIFHRCCSCAPRKFMPNNSPRGVSAPFYIRGITARKHFYASAQICKLLRLSSPPAVTFNN